MNLASRLDEYAKSQSDKPALIYADKLGRWTTVTYHDLANSTQRFFLGLQACHVRPGMHAALLTPPSIDFFPFAVALLKLGSLPIILDPAIGLKRIGECLAESKPDIFVGNAATHLLRVVFGWGKGSIKYNLTIGKVKSKKVKVISPPPDSQSLIANASAAILYTSGSTGRPKGAIYTQANFSAQLDMLQQTFNLSPDEIDLPAFPLYALIDVLLGVTSVIPDISFPVPGKTNPAKVSAAIQKFNVTNIFASPVVLDILADFWEARWSSSPKEAHQGHQLQSLKRVITAGAPAPLQLQQRFRKLLDDKTSLFGIYGATETLPIAIVESREVFALAGKSARGAGVCLGKPVEAAKVRIIPITDEPIEHWQDTLEVATNVVGEITVQGPAVTRSYIHREETNRLSKIMAGEEVIHRMGDVGYFDEQGRLWYCGRKSQRVETRYGTFFTEQIEGIFNVHPRVYRSALVGVNKEPVLWVEPQRGPTNQATIERELIGLARGHPQASQIKTFLFMKKFPTDVRHNSKIIREELKILAEKRLL